MICGAVLLALGVPAVLLGMSRRGIIGQISLFRRGVETARNPWKAEDESLEELAERVEKLRSSKGK